MRSLLGLIIVALLLSALMFKLLGGDAGYVLLVHGDTTVEMTLWTTVGLVILGVLLLWLLVQLLLIVFRVPGNWSQWRLGRHHKADIRRSNQGQIACVEGNWQSAQQAFAQVSEGERSAQPLMNYILAARANAALGDDTAAKLALLDGQKHVPDSNMALGIAEAEMQVERGQYSQALESLLRVRAVASSHPTALKLLAQIYEEKQEWSQLRKLLPKLNKTAALDSVDSLNLERRVYSTLLGQTGADKQALDHAWKQVPAELRNDPQITSAYANQLVSQGASVRAEKFLREASSETLPDSLINLYGQVQGHDVGQQLATVEGWLSERGQTAELLLCAGRLALANRKWDDAKGYFESCLKRDPNPAAYAELGRLLSHLGEQDASVECYQQGLLSVTGSLPELPMPKPRTKEPNAPALSTPEPSAPEPVKPPEPSGSNAASSE
jgi:HemY protein